MSVLTNQVQRRRKYAFFVVMVVTCAGTALLAQELKRPSGWNDATHSSQVKPDYARLFGMDAVHELRITIAPDRFRAMQDDLAAILPGGMGGGRGMPIGRGGAGSPPGMPSPELATAACTDKPAAAACTISGVAGQCMALFGPALMCMPTGGPGAPGTALPGGFRGGRGGAPGFATQEPLYVPVTVSNDGHTWTQVGMRYKGNSSLMGGNRGGNGKLPFRLDFNHYEEEQPSIKGQRFYGFEKLTFSSNMSDDSQLREVLATELFRDRGVPAARAAFYRIFVDSGKGPEYWGLYTMIEDPADGAMLDAQFGSRDGNLYKPEGQGADWTLFTREGFEKKTNKKKADYSDVEGAVKALLASTANPAAWRTALEARFDVERFLRWLAVNTVMENWDTYGAMAHNYYLYGNPRNGGRLEWIPWDHNMAFGMGPGGFPGGGPGGPGGFGGPDGPPRGGPFGAFNPLAGGPRGGPFGMGGTDILHQQVGPNWPLIQRLMADDVYAARYRALLVEALGGLFAPGALEKRARDLHALIASSVVGPNGERTTHTTVSSADAFERSLDGPNGLLQHIQSRQDAVRAALAQANR